MIFIKHNFIENYTNAVKSKDKDLVNALLSNEVAKILVSNRKQVVKILKDCGYNISDYATNEKLAKEVHSKLKTDSKFADKIKTLVLNYSELESKVNNFNVCADGSHTLRHIKNPENAFALKNGLVKSFSDDIDVKDFIGNVATQEKLQGKKFIDTRFNSLSIAKKIGIVLVLSAVAYYGYKWYVGKQLSKESTNIDTSSVDSSSSAQPTPQPQQQHQLITPVTE